MKKKLIFIALLAFVLFNITGCFDNNNLEGANITTSTYPVEYLVTRLYGEHSTISSIYPNDTTISEYDLTEKQIKTSYNENPLILSNLVNRAKIIK